MTTIRIAFEVPAAYLACVQALLDETAMHDCNWNGADFVIVRDDFTSIDSDSHAAATLLNRIQRTLSGEAEDA